MDPDQDTVLKVFKNHLIFENISGHLDLKDLKSFRGAHSGFNEASLTEIRKRAKAVQLTNNLKLFRSQEGEELPVSGKMDQSVQKKGICSETRTLPKAFELPKTVQVALNWDELSPVTEKDLGDRIRDINSFINLIRNGSGFPCSKFVLGTGLFSEELGDNLYLDNFLSAISGYVTELELKKKMWLNHTFFFKTPTLNARFEQLKTLKIEYDGNAPASNARNKDLTFFANLFAQSPNLTTVQISSDDQTFLPLCLEAMRGSQWHEINNLSLTGIIESRDFTILQQLGVKLKYLSVLYKHTAHTIPTSFLESQSSTLETLAISWFGFGLSCAYAFPRMDRLKRLTLGGPSTGRFQFPGLSFVEQFPALNHLSLCSHSNGSKNFFHSEMQPLTTVTTLELEGADAELVKEAARVFPSVKTLSVLGQLDLLQNVDAHMTNVAELIIRNPTDKGLSEYTEWELNHTIPRTNVSQIFPKERGEPLPIFKKIKVLRLRRFFVDDFMCTHGLLKCASLVSLDLLESPFSLISEGVLAKMKQQFKVHLGS